MFRSLRNPIARCIGLLVLVASLFLFAGSAFADPTDPDDGGDPPPPAPRPYSTVLQ